MYHLVSERFHRLAQDSMCNIIVTFSLTALSSKVYCMFIFIIFSIN